MNPRQLLADLARFPWLPTARTLVERFREDRLALSASSLTFTTTIALVPFFTVALALFTAFPIFAKLQANLQVWLVQSLVPEAIARQVLGYLTQFAGKASRLGFVGLGALVVSVFALVFTIDRTLNTIWRVPRPRPLGQRVMIYWGAITLGPMLLAVSLSTTSWVLAAWRGGARVRPGDPTALVLEVIEFLLLAAALSALYRFVPNTRVRPAHALAGGVAAAVGIELAKRLLAWYLGLVPTYAMVYGAFATVPILLVWIYIAWLTVLCGAVLTAHLPRILAGARRRGGGPGWPFQLALEALQALQRSRATPRHGMSIEELAARLAVEDLQLVPVLQALVELDWVGRVNEKDDGDAARYVLLADPQATPLAPLMRQLLLPSSAATEKLWRSGRLSSIQLHEVL